MVFMNQGYDHKAIEKKWQEKWQKDGTYKASNDISKPKKYILDMFPYPSGAGLHVGHPKGYIATDIISRYYRMNNFNVLHPMGWDAFGLPAEQFAIKNQIHPKIAVDQNVATFKEQLSIIGLDYDWSRELNTTDPNYYKWTQWAFLQMFKKGLAFESHEPINWCPSCKTGLANEDLEDGKCERCGSEIEQKPLRQWVLRITDYAERMLTDLNKLDKWPESVKTSQRNWIGKSEGAEISFKTKTDKEIKVFTTRPDTLFGVTYLVLAPEHNLIHTLEDNIENISEVKSYIEETRKKSPLERQQNKEKTGVELKGITAINPANGEEIPVWIADYVLANYGTGAVMAVPAHDERDSEFAKKFDLPVREVVVPSIEDEKHPHIEGLEIKERRNIHAIVYDLKRDAYLTLKWHDYDWQTIVVGGIENNEDEIETAKREVAEETGYINIEFKKHLGSPIQTLYAAPHKGINRTAWSTGLYFELIDGAQIETAREEHEKFDVVWMPAKEFVPENLTNVEIAAWLDRIAGKENIFKETGVLFESGEFTGMSSQEAGEKIVEKVGGEFKTTYKLQDWVFSRQRYWGEPIPIVHVDGKAYPLAEEQLPLELPQVEKYEPSDSGESPLADISEWVNVKGSINDAGEFVVSEDGELEGRRETNTMPQWAGSCWYYLRYIDPNNTQALAGKDLLKYWQPVDVYVGGMEHATRHLIYARFWHKFLFDIGVVPNDEPFVELHAPGIILAEDGRKMSKRWGNVVNPDEMVERFGADAFRLYESLMGPFDNSIAWNTDGVVGTRRFVERVIRYFETWIEDYHQDMKDSPEASFKQYNSEFLGEDINRLIHKAIKKISEDIPSFKFNTSVSALMVLFNKLHKDLDTGFTQSTPVTIPQMKKILQILAPFAPHIAEELWEKLGGEDSIHTSTWPKYDESKLVSSEAMVVVQVNGKIRAKIQVETGASEARVHELAMQEENVQKFVEDKPKKIIYVQDKLLNIVV